MVDEPKTLYRVGEPSIAEVYLSRWRYTRGTGGLGTGVYAFVTREAAEANLERHHQNTGKRLHVLRNALRNPLVVETFEGLKELNTLSRDAAFAGERLYAGDFSTSDLPTRNDSGSLYVDRLGGFGSSRQPSVAEGHGKDITALARRVQNEIPQLRRVGSPEQIASEMIRRAARLIERSKEMDPEMRRTLNQPINDIFYPQFDGVYPTPDSGGDNGTWGAVIWKQRIEECVGRPLASFETVEASVLDVCFSNE